MNKSQLSQQQALTDFNDLHVNFGLDAVKAQVQNAVSNILPFPAPLSPSPNKNLGQIGENIENIDISDSSGEEHSDNRGSKGEDGTYTLDLNSSLARFCVIEGQSKYWDMHRKTEIKKTAFIDMLGKQLYSEWMNHPKRKLIDANSVKNILNKDTAKLSKI